MVLCLIALPIFAILGIFSVRYRKLTLEALDCVFRTVTLRKCHSNLDERIRADLTGRVISFSPKAAGFIYNNYKLISWIFVLLLLSSTYFTAIGLYNYTKYGNCNGPEDTGFCVFDPTGKNSKIAEVDQVTQSEVVLPRLENEDPIIGNPNASLTIIEFGCYSCPYTKRAEPIIQNVLAHYQGRVNLQFKTFFIPHHELSYQSAMAANCAQEQGAYLKFHDALFANQDRLGNETFIEIATTLNLNITQFKECYTTEKYKGEINSDTLMGIHAAVPGTPTFYINEHKIVGPKPYKTFLEIIDEELA